MQHIFNSARLYLAIILVTVAMLPGAVVGAEPAGDGLAVYAGTVFSNNPAFDTLVLVEFPFSVNRNQFSFFVPDSTDDGLYARVFAQVDLFDSTGFAIDSVSTYFSLRVRSQSEAELPDYRVFNKLTMMVRPGSYKARLTVIDVVSKRQGEYFLKDVLAEPAPADGISLGGTRVAYNIRYVGNDDESLNPRLLKNGFYVVPNPVAIFTKQDTILFVYGEIYNLAFDPDNVTGYRLEMAAVDAQGEVYDSYGSRIAKKPGESAVITESFDISDYKLGSYSVRIIASDMQTGQYDTAFAPFHIVSPQAVLAAATQQEDQEIDNSDLSVEDHVNMAKVLLTSDELTVLNSLSDSGKMNFLKQYWKEHDIDPTTPVVENRLAQIQRFIFCNKVFSTNMSRTDGWMTDRGRIYLKYGRPERREENPAPRTSGNAYEIWHYYSMDEGKYFVFEDWTGSDDFRLVHSNVFGEVYSRGWQELMDQGFIDMPD